MWNETNEYNYVIEGAVEDSVDDDDADDDDGGIMCTASMRAENTIIIPATYYEKLHIYVSYHRYIKQCLNGQSKGL